MFTAALRISKTKLRKKPKKFHFILDSAFAHPSKFTRLSKKANLVHAVLDLGLSPQVEDKEIYQKAIQEDRFVLTVNLKDFKKLVQPGKPGIIGIESQLTNEQIDKLVTKFISGKNPEDFLGKALKI
jgi:hypothetical protein